MGESLMVVGTAISIYSHPMHLCIDRDFFMLVARVVLWGPLGHDASWCHSLMVTVVISRLLDIVQVVKLQMRVVFALLEISVRSC